MDTNKNLEIWLPIKGWESYYEISSLGRVRSLDKKIPHWRGGERLIRGRILRQFIRKRYLNVNLCIDYSRICAPVHKLVANAFIANPNKFPVTNHKDLNALNNKANNLEWCTISYNTKHAWDNGAFEGSKIYKRNQI